MPRAWSFPRRTVKTSRSRRSSTPAGSCPSGVHVYITGNYRKHDPGLPARAPGNVTFTGFLSEQDYVNLLFSADAVLALTTAQCTMLCACYEALAAGKALITSDSSVLREYFDRAIFVQNTPESIAQGIREFAEQPGPLRGGQPRHARRVVGEVE